MLAELEIRNLAVIESAHLSWRNGFCVVTGETGAGKSILMNSLKIILGERVKPDLIRKGAERLRVAATFTLSGGKAMQEVLDRLEIEMEGNELLIDREITAAGKNRCRVNGSAVSLGDLQMLGERLVDLHGQHQQQSLVRPETHLGFIDAYARLDEDVESFAAAWKEWRAATAAIVSREEENARLRDQQDFYRFQYDELEKAKLKEDEEDRIEAELRSQASLEKQNQSLQSALSLLDGEQGGLMAGLSQLRKELAPLERFGESERWRLHCERLEEAKAIVSDLAIALRGYSVPDALSPEKLDQLNARMAMLQKLKAKYKTDLPGLVALRDTRERQLRQLEDSSAETAALQAAAKAHFAEAASRAEALSRKRREAVHGFDRMVNAHLAELGMEGSLFVARLVCGTPAESQPASLNSQGADRLEFFLAANPGEDPKPLRLVASGGEASRVMLAIKTALAQHDPVPVLVFDEIDTGIGGVTANRVGNALKALSRHHQVIVITHLHQVAALADHHHRVSKHIEGGRTLTTVASLMEEQRVRELARMMGGDDSPISLQHARELLGLRA